MAYLGVTNKSLTADTNDLPLDDDTFCLRLTNAKAPPGPVNLTGMANGADVGNDVLRLVQVWNVSAVNIVLKSLSGASAATSQFAIAADVTLAANMGLLLCYDPDSKLWRAGAPV